MNKSMPAAYAPPKCSKGTNKKNKAVYFEFVYIAKRKYSKTLKR